MILAVCTFAHVNAGLLLVGQALPEEVAAASSLQGVIGFDGEEFLDALADATAPRDVVQVCASVERLVLDPGPRAWGILVFEPAIRVGDGDTVEDLRHRLHG